MKGFSIFIVLLVLLTAEGSTNLAQTLGPVSIGEGLCIGESLPGRPTLKRRQPSSQASANDELLQEEGCKQNRSCPDSDSNHPIRIEFEGLNAFAEVDVVKAFRERRIGLPTTQMPASEVLVKANELIKELLESRGYFNAIVDARENKVERGIVFIVYEGQRFPLAAVRFEGNRSFSSAELASKFGECEADYHETQGGYDSETFDYCTRRLLNFIRSRGHLRATFGQPRKEIDSRGLVLTLPLDEGLRYRLGEIKIEGSEAIAAEQIRAMLIINQGDIASGDEIVKWLFENLKKTYGERGYLEFSAEPVPEFRAIDSNEGIVDFTVSIDEGRQFRVDEIKFTGENLQEKELLSVLRLRPGDVFNQRLFEESIEELNKLGCFEQIDKDRDTDFTRNEEEGLITLVIKVNNLNSGATPRHLPADTR